MNEKEGDDGNDRVNEFTYVRTSLYTYINTVVCVATSHSLAGQIFVLEVVQSV